MLFLSDCPDLEESFGGVHVLKGRKAREQGGGAEGVLGVFKAKVPQNTTQTHTKKKKKKKEVEIPAQRERKIRNHLNQIRLIPLNGELDNRNSRPNSSINVLYGIGQDSI